jgi:hypothetical protein
VTDLINYGECALRLPVAAQIFPHKFSLPQEDVPLSFPITPPVKALLGRPQSKTASLRG